jgi:hypothetical protein
MNQLSINTELSRPTNNCQEVLYKAIQTGRVSLMDFPYLSGFRTRVSNLKLIYGINFDSNERIKSVNKHGRKISYVIHKLPDEEVEKAISVYKSIVE